MGLRRPSRGGQLELRQVNNRYPLYPSKQDVMLALGIKNQELALIAERPNS
jgi:hypothetical protein